MTKDEEDTLEKLIDKHGLPDVLQALSEICYAKADHVATNWQDRILAAVWQGSADRLAKLAIKTPRA